MDCAGRPAHGQDCAREFRAALELDPDVTITKVIETKGQPEVTVELTKKQGDGRIVVDAVPPDEFPERMRRAGHAAREILLELGAAVRPGITTDELDRLCHEYA